MFIGESGSGSERGPARYATDGVRHVDHASAAGACSAFAGASTSASSVTSATTSASTSVLAGAAADGFADFLADGFDASA